MQFHLFAAVTFLCLNIHYFGGVEGGNVNKANGGNAPQGDGDAEYHSYLKQFNKPMDTKNYAAKKAAYEAAVAMVKKNEQDRANPKSNVKYTLKINHLADFTAEEMAKLTSYKGGSASGTPAGPVPSTNIPDNFDWRSHNEMRGKSCTPGRNDVPPVRDQANCGSCYVFSAIGAIECAYSIKNGKMIDLSEQQIVDCSLPYMTGGCNGGYMHDVFRYVKDNGITTESSYPYTAADGKCKTFKPAFKLADFKLAPQGEDKIKQYVYNIGPLAAAIYVPPEMMLYSEGIFETPTCINQSMNHAIVIVGYGVEENNDFWIIRNSWAACWGENGYIRLARNVKMCGIHQAAMVPIL